MEQSDRHHKENLELTREQMKAQAAFAAAQLKIANRPLPAAEKLEKPEKPQPLPNETSADSAAAQMATRIKRSRQSGSNTVRGGGFRRLLLGTGTSLANAA